MKNKILVVSIALLLAVQSVAAQSPKNMDLRKELLQLQVDDQAIRERMPQSPEERETFIAVDMKHTARLKEMIDTYGWPSISLVGEDGATAAWLLAQHADADPNFQRQVLALMEPLVATGGVNASQYAYLWDRTHKPQKYGTQGGCVAEGRWEPLEIESPDEVDARRAEVGLSPMADYEKLVSKYCTDGG